MLSDSERKLLRDVFPGMWKPLSRDTIHDLTRQRLATIRPLMGRPVDHENVHSCMLGILESILEDATQEIPEFGAWLEGRLVAIDRDGMLSDLGLER